MPYMRSGRDTGTYGDSMRRQEDSVGSMPDKVQYSRELDPQLDQHPPASTNTQNQNQTLLPYHTTSTCSLHHTLHLGPPLAHQTRQHPFLTHSWHSLSPSQT